MKALREEALRRWTIAMGEASYIREWADGRGEGESALWLKRAAQARRVFAGCLNA